MLKRCLIAAIVFSASVFSSAPTAQSAEEMPAQNAVYFEFLGNGLVYTVNYDRMLTNHAGLRVGIGVISLEHQSGECLI